ncbi:serine/threonine-protein kinase TNNI3K-like [Trichogramma pretiosum]|uniref:serine/threonine-protein kinase TNNI3K-like n=1 Tax=Trichogramma pretiosum TaxID=7493 RepID=UPI000C719F72|nr:serine/threonine-protein kinase TNNI3K-like [Trichogramma pretiosum]
MSHSPLVESIEEKQSRFIELFIEQRDWTEEDVLAFVAVEFDGNAEDINWVIRTALERLPHHEIIIEILMKNGTELQVLNDLGQTAIHIAAINGKDYAIQKLLKHSRYENVSDNEGLTYFHIACMYGCRESVQQFIDEGVDINLPYYKDGCKETPLSLCIKSEYTKNTLELLLDNGADYKLLDGWDEDPLKYLKRFSRDYRSSPIHTLKVLADHYFEELLKFANHSEVIENRRDSEGFTYLHAACMSGNAKMVQKFIDQKDDLDLVWRLSSGTHETPNRNSRNALEKWR